MHKEERRRHVGPTFGNMLAENVDWKCSPNINTFLSHMHGYTVVVKLARRCKSAKVFSRVQNAIQKAYTDDVCVEASRELEFSTKYPLSASYIHDC